MRPAPSRRSAEPAGPIPQPPAAPFNWRKGGGKGPPAAPPGGPPLRPPTPPPRPPRRTEEVFAGTSVEVQPAFKVARYSGKATPGSSSAPSPPAATTPAAVGSPVTPEELLRTGKDLLVVKGGGTAAPPTPFVPEPPSTKAKPSGVSVEVSLEEDEVFVAEDKALPLRAASESSKSSHNTEPPALDAPQETKGKHHGKNKGKKKRERQEDRRDVQHRKRSRSKERWGRK